MVGRLTLGKRIALLVVLGLTVVISLFGFLSLRGLRESSDSALQERLVAAQLTARHIDNFLALYLDTLSEDVDSDNLNLHDADSATNHRLVEQVQGKRGGVFAHGIFLTDATGKVVWGEPALAHAGRPDPREYAIADEILKNSTPAVSNAFTDDLGRVLVSLGVPVRGPDGTVTGALVEDLDLSDPLLNSFVQPMSLGSTGYADIVDGNGLVLASSESSRLFTKSDHTDQFSAMIKAGKPTVGGCHNCHEAAGSDDVQPDILAFAPLSMAPWGVAIRQSEAEAFGPFLSLERSLIIAAAASLLAAIWMAWLASHAVVSPVRRLILASRRMASGDLDTTIDPTGPAEIGELAGAFDDMRAKLKASLEETVENARLYAECREREKLRGELLDRVIAAQEEERRRIARELHDDTCQSLAALSISLEGLEETLPSSAASARAQVKQLKTQVRATIGEVRTLALNLRPSILDDLGLVLAIDWYCREQLAKHGLDVKLDAADIGHRVSPQLETVLFRIAQEALNNVLKHSGASSARVQLALDNGQVVLEVEDKGRGFDADGVLRARGPRQTLGLHGMIERATLSGGVLRVLSSPGRGTVIRAELPIQVGLESAHEEDYCAVGRRSQDSQGGH